MTRIILINEDTFALLKVSENYKSSAAEEAKEMILAGKAERILVCEVHSRVTKEVRVDIKKDEYPDLAHLVAASVAFADEEQERFDAAITGGATPAEMPPPPVAVAPAPAPFEEPVAIAATASDDELPF